MPSRFSDEAWQATAPLRQAIDALPFNAELVAGRLGRERFQYYITQDALYLGQFSRALAIAAAKAPDTGALQDFAQSAPDAVVVERALQRRCRSAAAVFLDLLGCRLRHRRPGGIRQPLPRLD